MTRASTEVALSISTAGLEPDARERLWQLLIDHVVREGRVETFSVQPELVRPDTPPNVSHDREALLAHLELRKGVALTTLLRPIRWPIEPLTVGWVRQVGPWVYQATFWKGKQWILQSNTWGKVFKIVAQPKEWDRLRPTLEKELPTSLRETSTELRKLGEGERRGWSVTRSVRRALVVAAGLVAGLIAGMSGGEPLEGLATFLGVGFLVFVYVPQREPGPFQRLFGKADLPSDPEFDRRFQRLLGLGVIGAVVASLAGAAGAVAGPGSPWRAAWWALAALGAVAVAGSIGLSLRWLFKYQVR